MSVSAVSTAGAVAASQPVSATSSKLKRLAMTVAGLALVNFCAFAAAGYFLPLAQVKIVSATVGALSVLRLAYEFFRKPEIRTEVPQELPPVGQPIARVDSTERLAAAAAAASAAPATSEATSRPPEAAPKQTGFFRRRSGSQPRPAATPTPADAAGAGAVV